SIWGMGLVPGGGASARQAEQAGRFRAAGDGPAYVACKADSLAHELLVGRRAGSRVVLEPDPEVSAALEREPGDVGGEHVAPDHGDRPGEVGALEHRKVGLQAE